MKESRFENILHHKRKTSPVTLPESPFTSAEARSIAIQAKHLRDSLGMQNLVMGIFARKATVE